MSFDLEAFASQQVEPLATQFETIPEGEFPFIIDGDPKNLDVKEMKGESKRTGNPYHFFQLELICVCQDDAVKQKLGREKVTCRLRINLDLDASGRIESGSGKNIGLGQLRDALGQNSPGWTPRQLLGAGPFIGKVKHTKTDKGTYADIDRVAPVRR